MAANPRLPYRRRLVDPLLDTLLEQLPALLVVGPRTAGKTTTLARRAKTVIRLDRPAEAAAFEADADAALRGLEEPVLLDEWQTVPQVLGAVRRAVESDPHPGRFLVTGSVRAELDHEVWPATGRLTRVSMHPMAVREQLGHTTSKPFLDRVAAGEPLLAAADTPDLRGYVEQALMSGFPMPALRLTGPARVAWLESYIDDLLTHDVAQLERSPTRGRDTKRLRRYFEAYALSSAGVPDDKTIYDAAGVRSETARAYESLLADLLIAQRVPAWTSNRLKRLVKHPKRYLVDAALISTALRLDEDGVLRDGDILGRVLDTFVAAQLRAEMETSATRPRLHHLRTAQGRHEVDMLVELAGRRLIGIEVKATAAPTRRDAAHLAWLRDQSDDDRFAGGVVLHTGPRTYELDERIVAAPISALWA